MRVSVHTHSRGTKSIQEKSESGESHYKKRVAHMIYDGPRIHLGKASVRISEKTGTRDARQKADHLSLGPVGD